MVALPSSRAILLQTHGLNNRKLHLLIIYGLQDKPVMNTCYNPQEGHRVQHEEKYRVIESIHELV